MRTRIKICGVSDPGIASVACEAGADAIGLVFVDRSPRKVSIQQAEFVIQSLPPFVEPVGLFVDEPVERVREVIRVLGLRTIQLHGSESIDYVRQLAPSRVIKALAIDTHPLTGGLDAWLTTSPPLVGILWDAPQPNPLTTGKILDHEANHDIARASLTMSPAGGEGLAWDWSTVSKLNDHEHTKNTIPFVLAGGLNPDNVTQAIHTVRPYSVDVSSGVESSRGVKDAEKIHAFCRAVREADRHGKER